MCCARVNFCSQNTLQLRSQLFFFAYFFVETLNAQSHSIFLVKTAFWLYGVWKMPKKNSCVQITDFFLVFPTFDTFVFYKNIPIYLEKLVSTSFFLLLTTRWKLASIISAFCFWPFSVFVTEVFVQLFFVIDNRGRAHLGRIVNAQPLVSGLWPLPHPIIGAKNANDTKEPQELNNDAFGGVPPPPVAPRRPVTARWFAEELKMS